VLEGVEEGGALAGLKDERGGEGDVEGDLGAEGGCEEGVNRLVFGLGGSPLVGERVLG
jgi:hypothetical protein